MTVKSFKVNGDGVWADYLSVVSPAQVSIAAFLLVLILTMYFAHRDRLDERIMYWASVWGIAGALLGQPFLNLIFSPSILFESGLKWSEVVFYAGPRGVYSALIGAGMAGFLYLRLKKQSFLSYADTAIPAVLLGYVVARIGCFIGGHCFGVPTDLPWAVAFAPGTDPFQAHLERGWMSPEAGQRLTVHPTQLYHVLAGLAGFVLLLKWRPSFPGDRLALALMFYGIARFIIQFYRDEHWAGGAVIDQAQWFCIAFVVSGLALWTRNRWVSGRNRVIAVS